VPFYSDDALDFEYSSPFEYQQQKKELYRYGNRRNTPYPPLSPTPSVFTPSPPSVLTETIPASTIESERGLDTTLSPGIDISKEFSIEDLLVDFEEERKLNLCIVVPAIQYR